MVVNLLNEVYLFKGLNENELRLLERIAVVLPVNEGEVIFHQGALADSFYVIQYGSVRVEQKISSNLPVELTTLGAGDHFGEMAMLDDTPRSATVTALQNSNIICFKYFAIETLLKSQPRIYAHFYRQLSCSQSHRLRATTLRFSSLRTL